MKDNIDYNKIGTLTAEEAIEALKVYEKTACDCAQMKGANACRIGIRAIESQVCWIPCVERMPDIEEMVLLSLRSLDIYVGFRANTEGQFFVDGEGYVKYENVLAWQPLPEPYKS